MKYSLLTLTTFFALMTGMSGMTFADSKCSDVNINVTNKYRDPVNNAKVDIKVVDFKYWDKEDNKWRNELTDNKRIDPDQTASWNKNLAYVGGESGVKIKVYYKYSQAGGGWSAKHSKLSSAFKCVDGMPVDITID